jgi:hypothetical protein
MRQQVMNYLKNGFDAEDKGFSKADGRGVEVTVSETSVCIIGLFVPWDGKTLLVQLLIKHFEIKNVLITFLWLDHGCAADI